MHEGSWVPVHRGRSTRRRRIRIKVLPPVPDGVRHPMNEKRIVGRVHDFFHKEIGAGSPKAFCTECWQGDWGGRADLAFIRSRSDNLHVVEAKASLDGAFKAIEQLRKYPANYWWIALPADEYVPGAGLLKAASEEGIDVLIVHDRLREPVEVKRKPGYEAGDYLGEWPRLEREWYETG